LDTDKLEVGWLLAFHLKAKLNGFADIHHKFVK
jgi:hypothetical protein